MHSRVKSLKRKSEDEPDDPRTKGADLEAEIVRDEAVEARGQKRTAQEENRMEDNEMALLQTPCGDFLLCWPQWPQ